MLHRVVQLAIVMLCGFLLHPGTLAAAETAPSDRHFEGYGARTTGGTGKRVVTVTNLRDSGPGSFRGALGSNRTIKFSVAGTIKLSSFLPVYAENLTIDGFSAPSPGITLTGASRDGCLQVYGPGKGTERIEGGRAANIVIQGLRIRACTGNAVKIGYGAHDIVVDHVSMSGGTDGTLDVTTGAHDVTISWNIIANNVNASGATLVKYEAYHISFHHNVWFNNYGNSRVPWCEGGDDAPNKGSPRDLGVICDVRYNVISKWLIGTLFETDGRTATTGNIVSNYYDGQDSDHARNNLSLSGDPLVSVYVAGNASVLNPKGCPYGMSVAPGCISRTNDGSRHGPYAVPDISGPSPTDDSGRIATWLAVLKQAGVSSHFPDDSEDTLVRSGITPPDARIFKYPWNVQIN